MTTNDNNAQGREKEIERLLRHEFLSELLLVYGNEIYSKMAMEANNKEEEDFEEKEEDKNT